MLSAFMVDDTTSPRMRASGLPYIQQLETILQSLLTMGRLPSTDISTERLSPYPISGIAIVHEAGRRPIGWVGVPIAPGQYMVQVITMTAGGSAAQSYLRRGSLLMKHCFVRPRYRSCSYHVRLSAGCDLPQVAKRRRNVPGGWYDAHLMVECRTSIIEIDGAFSATTEKLPENFSVIKDHLNGKQKMGHSDTIGSPPVYTITVSRNVW